jgi:hypothetical protein
MLGDRWLAQLEPVDEMADGLLAVTQQVEDLDSVRLAQRSECGGAHLRPKIAR